MGISAYYRAATRSGPADLGWGCLTMMILFCLVIFLLAVAVLVVFGAAK